jgi:hypothetical protein
VSHKATDWAIQQRGLPPAAKLVLWHLCDRYHPDNGCFPSQVTLADDCELSRSSLNDQLDKLESAGLIRRERQHGEGNRRRSTRYRFAFETGFEVKPSAEPCPNSGHGAMSENDEKPCPNCTESHVRISDSNLVSEPVIEPERERARDDLFKQALKRWPVVDSPKAAQEAWNSLSIDDRIEAANEIERFVGVNRSAGRKLICSFARYLSEQMWKGLPERPKLATALPSGTMSIPPTAPKSKFLLAFERQKAIEAGSATP